MPGFRLKNGFISIFGSSMKLKKSFDFFRDRYRLENRVNISNSKYIFLFLRIPIHFSDTNFDEIRPPLLEYKYYVVDCSIIKLKINHFQTKN